MSWNKTELEPLVVTEDITTASIGAVDLTIPSGGATIRRLVISAADAAYESLSCTVGTLTQAQSISVTEQPGNVLDGAPIGGSATLVIDVTLDLQPGETIRARVYNTALKTETVKITAWMEKK